VPRLTLSASYSQSSTALDFIKYSAAAVFFCERKLSYQFWFGLLQEEAGCVLELPNKKARGFLVPIAFKRLFTEHVRKVFGEMPVRT
jgi:hypothetical protein